MIILRNKKLICYSNRYFVYSQGTRIIIIPSWEKRASACSILPMGNTKSKLGLFRLIARALRLEPRCGIFIDDSIALVSYHGAIYKVNCATGDIILGHHFRPEMNNPLSFVNIQGINGFTDGIYYGEYFLNHESKEVNLLRRNNDGTWTKAYTFAPGEVYHIHNIIPCPEKECVYVLTGDKDEESAIYECKNDFAEVKAIVRGKQSYRSCVAMPTKNGLLYTTDTPLEDNYLYHLDFATKEIRPIIPIAGPSIYGKQISDTELVFSTSVEPDSGIKGLRYEFTYKLGPGVKDRKTHLYYVKVDGDDIAAKEIFSATKDILPCGVGQFGTLMFPAGKDEPGTVMVTGQAVRKYDNKTLKINL